MKKPIVLIIMDGWGIAPSNKGNAVALASTPNLDLLTKQYPHTELIAHGKCVGLPEEQDGNSEAGHMNLGAARIVDQDAVKINKAIQQGKFENNPAFIKAIKHVKKHNSRMHLMGLLADKMSAHAYPDHLYALLDLMAKQKVPSYLHLFTDGRDSSQHGAIMFLRNLMKSFKNGEKIATVQGRYYAMERNKRWEVTQQAYELLTKGTGLTACSAEEAITQAYNRGETDEFIKPTLVDPEGLIQENDAVIFFNLRSDRARQLSKAFVQPHFDGFNRLKLDNLCFVAMTDFGPDLDSILSAFPSEDLKDTLPMLLKEKKQLYIAESEKYAHVTYFFNGGYADPVNGEERISIPSPDCRGYNQKPAMSASQITDVVTQNIAAGVYDFYCINYANPDMVGHTGVLSAGIKACEVVDEQVGKVVDAVTKAGGLAVITADHGNAEEMINLKTGEVDTKHSSNPVPLIVTKKGVELESNQCLGYVGQLILKLFKLC